MKRIDTIISPTDILNEELNNLVGGGCTKQKNKCKDGTVNNNEDLKQHKHEISVW